MQVIDNFLTPSYHYEMLRFIESGEMQWYYSPDIDGLGNPSKNLGLHGFSNHFYDIMREIPINPFQSLMMPFLLQVKDVVNSPRVLRGRVDMTLYNPSCLPDACGMTPHVDMEGKHHTSVYYVNDSDGDTVIGDKRVSPKANRVVIFDGDIIHYGHSPCKHNNRIIINSNYDVR